MACNNRLINTLLTFVCSIEVWDRCGSGWEEWLWLESKINDVFDVVGGCVSRRSWMVSGATSPRCRLRLSMVHVGTSSPRRRLQSSMVHISTSSPRRRLRLLMVHVGTSSPCHCRRSARPPPPPSLSSVVDGRYYLHLFIIDRGG